MCLESSSGRPPCRSLAAPSIARGLHDSCALSALNNASKLPTIIDVGDECKNSVNTKTPSWTRKTVSCRGRLARPTRGDPRRDDGDDQGRLAREGEVIVRSLLRDRLRPHRGLTGVGFFGLAARSTGKNRRYVMTFCPDQIAGTHAGDKGYATPSRKPTPGPGNRDASTDRCAKKVTLFAEILLEIQDQMRCGRNLHCAAVSNCALNGGLSCST